MFLLLVPSLGCRDAEALGRRTGGGRVGADGLGDEGRRNNGSAGGELARGQEGRVGGGSKHRCGCVVDEEVVIMVGG